MNQTTRKKLNDLSNQIDDLKSQIEELADVTSLLTILKSELDDKGNFIWALLASSVEEQEKFDNLPEGLQLGEMGQAIYEATDALYQAASNLEETIGNLEEAGA